MPVSAPIPCSVNGCAYTTPEVSPNYDLLTSHLQTHANSCHAIPGVPLPNPHANTAKESGLLSAAGTVGGLRSAYKAGKLQHPAPTPPQPTNCGYCAGKRHRDGAGLSWGWRAEFSQLRATSVGKKTLNLKK